MSLPKPDTETTVVITGASSGIGAELARGLARRGFPLLLVARRRERLEELANEVGEEYSVAVEVIPLDLSDSKARVKLANRLRNEPIAGLCNSAGFGTSASSTTCPRTESEERSPR
jgi:short-subunit dehydrogenase